MRITNKMITTQYTRSLNRLAAELNRLNNQVSSGRKFAKASENTSAAVKAFQLRKDMSRIEGYRENIAHAKSTLTNAESALMHIEELMRTATEKIITGLNDTQSREERAIIATELRSLQAQLLQTLNSTASDSYYFGGTNTETKPFEVIDGKLYYNGYDLDLPLPASTPEENEAKLKELASDTLYIDIGLSVKFDPATGEIDEGTVFGYSIAGINVVGSGTTTVEGEEVSNNIYNLLGALAAEFESENYSHAKADALFGHLKDASQGIMRTITEIGAKTSYLDFMAERLEDQDFNLQERQVDVEGIDPAEAIINFEAQKFAYNAALQMGARIIQPSIFDFMR
ncbi:MAG TPA: flagellar hook-associated protein FlgL [Bacillota bacterium]|nr:flagellar hook-associated protein FlgL [Bacillota bacterium]HPZ59250.1 flagellar hook-associated protein FlgL [Bacillota bacterium]HQC82254.1 flagellar hook-associated protein FlgL [Bacillota bacterium]